MNAKTKKRIAELEALIAAKNDLRQNTGREIDELALELERISEFPKRVKYVGRCYLAYNSGGRFYDYEHNRQILWPRYTRIDSIDENTGEVTTTSVDIYPDETVAIDMDVRSSCPSFYETGRGAGRLLYKRIKPSVFKKALNQAIARVQ